MARILRNLGATLALAVLLLAVVAFGFHGTILTGDAYASAALGFLRLLAIAMWIGQLFAFNFLIQPGSPIGAYDGISSRILADGLGWSRYAALFVIAIGLLLAIISGNLGETLLLRGAARVSGFGLWLAILMAANLWLFIWPLQKRALGLIAADSDIRANAAIVATLFSRINLLLALPMLYCLATAPLTATLQ